MAFLSSVEVEDYMLDKERLRSDVRDACQEYITSCRRHLNDTLARPLEDVLEDATVDIFSTDTHVNEYRKRQSIFATEKTVVQPSQLLTEIPDSFAEDAFGSVASQLAKAVDFPLENPTDISNDSIDEEKFLYKNFRKSLANFAGEVMDYTGDTDFNSEAFEAAYNQQFFPGYTDREVYDIVIPMPGVHIKEDIELPDVPTLETKFEGPYQIEQFSIKPLTYQIDNGVRTYHGRRRGHTSFSDRPADVAVHVRLRRRRPYREIKSDIASSPVSPIDPRNVSVFANDLASWNIQSTIVSEILSTLSRTLYLWNQRVEPGFENGYLLAPNWLDYRESVVHIADEFYIEAGQTQGMLTFPSDRGSFADFWRRYSGYLTDRGSFVEKPVTRLETMFDRESPEDAVLDALIALEGSLLQGTTGSSYTFRLKLRSRLLLENLPHHVWPAEKTGDIATELYQLRGRLIHHDDAIEEAIEKEDLSQLSNLSGYEVMIRARTLLAHVILAFLDQHESHGLQPQDVTKAVDDAALTTSYDPDRARELSQD